MKSLGHAIRGQEATASEARIRSQDITDGVVQSDGLHPKIFASVPSVLGQVFLACCKAQCAHSQRL